MSEWAIKAPRIGANEDYDTIAAWIVKNGEHVSTGQEIVSLETTKEVEDIKAEREGYLFYNLECGTDIKVGDVLAVISDSPNFVFEKKNTADIQNITAKAKALIDKYNVDISELSNLDIIREKDVRALVAPDWEVCRSKANDIIIVSGGGLAKMCIDLIQHNKAYNIHGITDPNEKVGSEIMGIKVLGGDEVLEGLRREGYMTAVNAQGSISVDNQSGYYNLRKTLFEKIKDKGFFLPTLIHPSASVSISAQIGEGTLVFEQAIIGSDAQIGDNCIINSGAIVSHDCKIGNHTRISPGAVLAGNVEVGENSLIGMGVTIYVGAKIGRNVVIANGKDIVGNIPDNSIVR